MQVVTAAIIMNFDENVRNMRDAFTSLRAELVRQFPKTRSVNFDFESQSTALAPKSGQPYYYP
jgi:hypothetical protein